MSCKTGLVIAVGLSLVVVSLLGGCVVTAGRFLAIVDNPPTADAIISLGGDTRSFARVRHAVDLWEQGYAPVVVLSGGTMADVGLACSSAQLSLKAAGQLGLPPESTVIAPEAQSTYDEAVNLAGLVRERGWRSVIIVTDVFHTRRAARAFRTFLPDTAVYVSAAPDPRYDPVRWWANEYSLTAVVKEWLKLGFYWLKYGISPV